MNTKVISNPAMSVIDQYVNFRVANAVCSVPYYNNKTVRARAAFRTFIGKGSPKDIYYEVQAILVKDRAHAASLTNDSLKRLLVDNNLGIECSGFAYYVLNAESESRGKGQIDKHITFAERGLFGKLRSAIRPVENCDVSTFAHDKNSVLVSLKEVLPGDMIIMIGQTDERDHIMVIHQVEYQNFVPTKIHYSHSIAYPEDGIYDTGVRRGMIEVSDPNKPLTEARWTENGKEGSVNRIHEKALSSKTEIRRLKWFS